MKNVFNGHFNRYDAAEEKYQNISKLEGRSIEIAKIKT